MRLNLVNIIAVALAVAGCRPAQAQQNTDNDDKFANSQRFEQVMDSIAKTEMELYQKYRTLYSTQTTNHTDEGEQQLKELERELNRLSDEQVDLTIGYAKANKGNTTPAKYLADAFYAMTYQQLQEVLTKDAAYYNAPELRKAKQYLELLKTRAPGTPFKELTMADTNGTTHKLSEWVGRGGYVLVDFWASWCGPCRMEMPNVVEAYNKYNAKGFDVVGVSFDNDAASWKDAIRTLQMPWHHISDLKGWDSAATTIYGIRSIPANILVDPQGKIIDIDLRGEKLLKRLAEIYQ